MLPIKARHALLWSAGRGGYTRSTSDDHAHWGGTRGNACASVRAVADTSMKQSSLKKTLSTFCCHSVIVRHFGVTGCFTSHDPLICLTNRHTTYQLASSIAAYSCKSMQQSPITQCDTVEIIVWHSRDYSYDQPRMGLARHLGVFVIIY